MTSLPKPFRSDESIEYEGIARGLIKPLFESRGFKETTDTRKRTGTAVEQIIRTKLPNASEAQVRVKLCWRRRKMSASEKAYSAAQLIAKVSPGESESRVRAFAAKAAKEGTDYFLFVQVDAGHVELAALVPVTTLGDVWVAQRDKSTELIAAGKMGRRHKNHAENGHSPTLWLKDDFAPEVPETLWKHSGVIDLLAMPTLSGDGKHPEEDDTFQDTVIIDYGDIGSDTPKLVVGEMSHVKRDARVRRTVLKRANGNCERPGCISALPFAGFLDVHHILGVGTSDRIWNCIALCPNCHREAHISPNADELNKTLLAIASLSYP
jgi:5-methylcytosine-specific restriction protein A